MSALIAQVLRSPPQSFWLVGSIGVNAVVSLATIPLFVELLSAEDLATLAQAGGIALAVSTICSLGANTIGPHIVSGQLGYLKTYDELLGNQLFAVVSLMIVLLTLALVLGVKAGTLAIFAMHFGAGVSSALSPNWLMVQRGQAHRIFIFHVMGRLLFVGVLVYFVFVGGGLLLASAGLFAGSVTTSWLVFASLQREMMVHWRVLPIGRSVLRQAVAVTSPSVAVALLASAAPFVLQALIGLGAVGVYYVAERCRVFVSEVLRTAETPYYQAIARGDGQTTRSDVLAMPIAAIGLAAAFPILAAWGPKLNVIGMLVHLWPYLVGYCLALSLSIRAATLFVDGKRAFGGSAALRISSVCVAAATLTVLCILGVESSYAVAIIVGELALALAAYGYSQVGVR